MTFVNSFESSHKATLIAGRHSSTGEVAAWQEARNLKAGAKVASQLRSFVPATPVDVCQYRGTFGVPIPPPLPGATEMPLPDVLQVIVLADGSVAIDQAGYSDLNPPTLP